MATYDEAVKHVKGGGRAWEAQIWDTESYLYQDDEGTLMSYCGVGEEAIKYIPDEDEVQSTHWELFEKEEKGVMDRCRPCISDKRLAETECLLRGKSGMVAAVERLIVQADRRHLTANHPCTCEKEEKKG